MERDPLFPPFRHQVDRLFDVLIHSNWGVRPGLPGWVPFADVCEAAETYRIELDLPGVRHADLSISAHGRTLRLQGLRHLSRPASPGSNCLAERPNGHFSRSFQLPDDADAREIRARLEDGVLTVEIPRVGSQDRRKG
jgi:HSP20 family protein